MRQILTLIITVSCLFQQLHAQLVVNNSFTPQQLVQNTLIGSGVSVSNITFTGAPLQIGKFTNTGTNALGLTSGIVMASGQTDLLSNVATNTGGGTTFGNPGTPGDASLDGISTGGTNDAAVLEFDFVPINDTIKFRYVFASEEYNEFVCSNFNDVFAFFLTGPGFPTPTNIALIPGTNIPVTINSVNIGTPGASSGGGTCSGVNQSLANAGFFVDNPLGSVSIEFDGLTTVLTARAVVVPCQTYHIKLAIADVTDSAFDSGVFLEANSFGTNALNINVDTYLPGNQLVEGCTSGSVTLSLSAPAPTAYSIPVISIGGTATQNTDYTTNLPPVIVIPAGQQSFNFNIVPTADGTVDDNETIQILFQSLTCRVDTLNLTIREAGVLSLAQSNFVICDGVTNTLQFNALAYNDPLTGGTFTWSPTTGLSNPNIRNPVATVSSPGTYTVTYSSGNCVQTAQVNITASPYSISFPPQTDQILCSGGSVTLNTNLNTGAPTAAFTNTTATPIPKATATTPLTTTDIPIVVSGMFPTTISTAAELALINSMCFRINNQLVDHLVITLISPSGQQLILSQNNGGAGNAYNNSCFTRTATLPISNYNNIPIPANGSFIPQGGAAGWNNFIGSTVNGTWIMRINHNGTGTTYNGNFLNATLTLNNINNPVLTWTPPAGLSCTTCASPVATPTVTTTYQVVASNASGCSDTAQVTVFVQSDLPAPQVTCVSSTINSVTFGWAPVAGAASYNVSTDGINFVTNGTNTTYTINGLAAGQSATLTVIALAPAGSVCGSSQPGTATCTAGGCPALTPLITGNTVVCQGQTTVLSGEAGFVSYSWSSGSNVSIASVPAGGVTLTVTDANNCTGTASTTVTSTGPVPVINASATAVCSGGTATLSVGQTFASYQWSLGNATTQSITVSAAGTYTVTVTDTNGCTGIDDILFSVNPNPQPSITGTSAICTGTTTLLNAGNYALYAWTTPDGTNPTTNPITVGTAGNYVVTVTNTNGCTGTASFNLTVNANPIAQIVGDTSICNGTTSVLDATNAAAVQYAWTTPNNTFSTATITANTAGLHSVTITDANGCTGTASTTVTTTAPVPVINASATAVCPGGTAILTVGQTFASYQWSLGNAPTQSITVSAAGTYSVTVTDANGCIGTDDILFSINPNPQPSITGTSIICTGTTTFLNAGNYVLYAWTTPDGTNPTTNPINVGTGGNYVVTVTNANGCTGTASFALSISNNLQPVITGTPAICDGSVSSLDPGSFLQYVWNTPQGISTTRFIDAQTAGVYTVTVSEANGCTGTASFNLTVNPNPIAQILGDTSICNGATTLLDATSAAAVQYAWTIPNNTFSTATITANTAGLHSVTITDANGCTGSAARTVVLINGLTPTITPLGNTTICNGSSVGLDAGVYDNYNWSTTATSQIIQADATGVYSVTVQNSNGCIGSASINITELAPIQSTATSTAVSCNGGADGALNTQTTGGTGNYTYLWSNNATTANISNVAAGTYTLTVTDNLGCTGTASFNITQPPTAVAVLTIRSNATCNSVANGNAIANPSGGTGPYTFAWSNGSNTAASSNLAANTPYTVTVTDSRGCTVSETFTIGEPSAVVLTFSNITPTLCFNSNDGHATVTPSGGTPGYTYQWGSGETGVTAVLLAGGNASVTVSDNNGCTFTQNVNIPSPTPIEITLVNTNSPDCNGTATGSATVTANGSTPPYSYSWDLAAGLQLTATATGLPAGVFGITVTDIVGCTSNRQVTVANTNALEGQLTGTPINCHGNSTGTITSAIIGGNAPYTYLWSNGETTANLSDVAAGTYILTVTDSRGCTLSLSYNMTQPDQLVLSATSLDPACYNSNDGNINLTATGGTLPYQYNINGGTYRLGSNFASLGGGTYQLMVRDAHECLDGISVTLTPPAPINASIFPAESIIEYGDSLQIIVSANGTVTYQWQADTTLSCDTCPAPYANPHISTTYTVTVIDANGCDTTLISRVNVIFNRRVYVPNLFSPNGDGNNDLFYVQGGRGLKEVKAFRVFDRWGELVYQQEHVLPNTPGWDGTFKGKAVGQGVFAWYAEILYDDGLVELIKGDVTVVR